MRGRKDGERAAREVDQMAEDNYKGEGGKMGEGG